MTVVNLQPDSRFNLAEPKTLVLDLNNPKPKEVFALVETFDEAMRANPDLGKLPVKTGWNEITPAIGINLLMRNRPGANRKVDPATVFYYAGQMAKGEWKATGQPILVDSNGVLQDAQHRLLAGLISGTKFKSFVVTDIPPIENMFAYIDNNRPRTAAAALQTAGFDGVAPLIVKVITIGEEVRAGVYNPYSGLSKLPRMYPAQVLGLVESYPNVRKAARSAASDWEQAVDILSGRKAAVAYLGMRIADLHDEEVADNFFDEVMAPTEGRSAGDPILDLRKLAEKDSRADKPMKSRHLLAAMIKTFNAWHKHEVLGRRWMLMVDEDFPEIVSDKPQADAA